MGSRNSGLLELAAIGEARICCDLHRSGANQGLTELVGLAGARCDGRGSELLRSSQIGGSRSSLRSERLGTATIFTDLGRIGGLRAHWARQSSLQSERLGELVRLARSPRRSLLFFFVLFFPPLPLSFLSLSLLKLDTGDI